MCARITKYHEKRSMNRISVKVQFCPMDGIFFNDTLFVFHPFDAGPQSYRYEYGRNERVSAKRDVKIISVISISPLMCRGSSWFVGNGNRQDG